MTHLIRASLALVLALVPTQRALRAGGAQVAASDAPRTYVYREIDGRGLRAFAFAPSGVDAQAHQNAILLFHGGGWSAGSPEWTFDAARHFADAGLLAISVEYRLSEGAVTPVDALHDVCAAFVWARTLSTDLGFGGRMAGYGVSAGGHLVASTVTVGCPSDPGTGRALPEALVLLSPALDVTGDGWFVKRLQDQATPAAYSPAEHVRASTPPTSIVHGEKDTLTPLVGIRRFCDRLTALGGVCELNVYPGLGHLLTRNLANQESDFDPDPAARADGFARHLRFLRTLGFVPSR